MEVRKTSEKIMETLARWRILAGYIYAILFIILSCPRFSSLPFAIFLIAGGLLLRTWAAGTLVKGGELITAGPYSLIRHPLYIGSFFIGLGGSLLGGILWLLLFTTGFPLFYTPKILTEENHLRRRYGEKYETYRKKVHAFFPKTLSIEKDSFSWKKFFRNREYRVWGGVLFFFIIYFLKGKMLCSPEIF